MSIWVGAAWCLAIASCYVLSLYAIPAPGSRQHPRTVTQRMLAAVATSCAAWLPVRLRLAQLSRQVPAGAGRPLPAVRELLGLGWFDAGALATPLLLTAVLFSGPLLHTATVRWEERQWRRQWRRQQQQQQQQQQQGEEQRRWRQWWWRQRAAWQGPGGLHALRDLVTAPVTEEWCFRACMVPLLWLEGASLPAVVLLVPLFFGLGHLHHAREMVVVHGWPLGAAAAAVGAQFLYTTAFGWFAAWCFVATGQLAPAVAVHALCNALGVPPFGAMAAHPRGRLLLAATAVGVAAFGAGVAAWVRAATASPGGRGAWLLGRPSVYLQRHW